MTLRSTQTWISNLFSYLDRRYHFPFPHLGPLILFLFSQLVAQQASTFFSYALHNDPCSAALLLPWLLFSCRISLPHTHSYRNFLWQDSKTSLVWTLRSFVLPVYRVRETSVSNKASLMLKNFKQLMPTTLLQHKQIPSLFIDTKRGGDSCGLSESENCPSKGPGMPKFLIPKLSHTRNK